MPLFIFLLFIGGILVWLLMSSAFVPIGSIAKQIWKDAKNAINEKDEETDERED